MSRMRKASRIAAITVCAVIMTVSIAAYALFQGYFDRGLYEVKEVQRFSPTQVAVVARTSNHRALDGDIYFVLIGDHVFSPKELRKAYYKRGAVFATNRDCLTVKWQGSRRLVIDCIGSAITPDQIDVQHHQSGQIAVSYINVSATN